VVAESLFDVVLGTASNVHCQSHMKTSILDAGRLSNQMLSRSDLKRSESASAQLRTGNPSDLPSWLTRDAYITKVQPALATIAKSRIRSALGVSEPYSTYIQTGKLVPHSRHWIVLAELVGVQSGRAS